MNSFAESAADLVELGSGQVYDLNEKLTLFSESLERQLAHIARVNYANTIRLAGSMAGANNGSAADAWRADAIRDENAHNNARATMLRAVQSSGTLSVLQRGIAANRSSFRAFDLRSFDELFQQYYDFV